MGWGEPDRGKRRKSRLRFLWKGIAGISAILGLVTSILHIIGAIDLNQFFVVPMTAFLLTSIPAFWVIILGILLIVANASFRSRFGKRSYILDFSYGRRLALLCQSPKTTEFLRGRYKRWESQSTFIGGYRFDDYMKLLEKEGFLNYIDGNWNITTKALSYITKYHGGP